MHAILLSGRPTANDAYAHAPAPQNKRIHKTQEFLRCKIDSTAHCTLHITQPTCKAGAASRPPAQKCLQETGAARCTAAAALCCRCGHHRYHQRCTGASHHSLHGGGSSSSSAGNGQSACAQGSLRHPSQPGAEGVMQVQHSEVVHALSGTL